MKNTTEGFSLRGTIEEQNTKERKAAFFTDIFCLILYLGTATGWMIHAFTLEVSRGLLMAGIVLVSFAVSVHKTGKRSMRKIAGRAGAAVWILLPVLLHSGFLNGCNLMLNHVIDALGRQYPYMWPVYEVTVPEDAYATVISLTLIWFAGSAGCFFMYLVRSKSRLFLGICLLWFLVTEGTLKLTPGIFWNAAAVIGILTFWFRSRGEQLPLGRQRLAVPGIVIQITVIALTVFGVIQLVYPVSSYQKDEKIQEAGKKLISAIEKKCFRGNSTVLPEGDFRGLGSFTAGDTPVLEVTMSQPESYYLRGFTGSIYTGTGWEESENEERWEYRDLFYWLHKSGYYGQEALANAALALGGETAEKTNQITIKNENGSSRYCYVPYELSASKTDGTLPYASQKIGDETVVADGMRGKRSYTYDALMGQVSDYTTFAGRLLAAEEADETVKQYQQLESYYNEYVYETYLEISANLRTELKELAGVIQIEGNAKHADYAEAKQNILYLLSSECVYEEDLTENWDGADFVADFLNRTKSGYSVHYASATVMLFRYYGIPARYVEGYLVTPSDVEQMTADEPYILDETHAHAWAEYYQDGVGWLPFETTPSYLNLMPKAEAYQDISGISAGSGSNREMQEDDLEEGEEGDTFDYLFVIGIVLAAGIVLVLLVFFALSLYVLIQRHKSKKWKRSFESPDTGMAVRSIFSYTMNLLAVSGMPIRNISLYHYAEMIGRIFGADVRRQYEDAVTIRQMAVYSRHEITEEQRKQMLQFEECIWEHIRRESGWIQRFRLKYIYFL